MAILEDLPTATLIAVVVFLTALGLLVVFTEVVSRARTIAFLVGLGAIAIALALGGELGVAFVFLGIAAAILANGAFEWLTTRT